ncbi:MAG: HD-GYP domain-containing protein [Planctomycetota bacterium]|jgi:HD-GYP domain-containing protein (c-di-GMP phosphodiesterase class II)
MLRVPITDVQPGDILARSVVNPSNPETPLLKRGVALTTRVIGALRRMGIRSLWLHGDGLGYLEDVIKEDSFKPSRQTLGELKKTFSKLSSDISYTGSFAIYRDRVIDIFRSIKENNRIYCMLDDIRVGSDDILFHGSNVCYLSMLIGLEAEVYIFEERRKSAGKEIAAEFAPLGLGALLHDIGKLQIEETVRNRSSWELSSTDIETLKSHTSKGYKMLKEQLDAITANMALCHHLNFDGTGYPEDPKESAGQMPEGNNIHIFSRVVSVANAYDSLVGDCDYLPIEALEELNCARRHHFDQKLLAALNRIVPPFSLGSRITLNSGFEAMVTDFNPQKPFRPGILLLKDPKDNIIPENKRKEVDMSDYPEMKIKRADNRKVDYLIPDNPDAKWEDLS